MLNNYIIEIFDGRNHAYFGPQSSQQCTRLAIRLRIRAHQLGYRIGNYTAAQAGDDPNHFERPKLTINVKRVNYVDNLDVMLKNNFPIKEELAR